MTKYQGGYIGNTPNWADQNRSGVWNAAEQVSLKAKNQWPLDSGTIALRYILRNFDAVEGKTYDSGTITVQRDPDLIFWGVTGAGFSGAQGGPAGVSTLGNYSASSGEAPRGAVYLSWRRQVVAEVATVNGTGAITSVNIQQLGKGLKASNNNTSQSFVSTSTGTGATFVLTRDASNLTLASLNLGGSGYTPGDILTWQETLGDGSGSTMDPYWDLILHGVGGRGGAGSSQPNAEPNYSGGGAAANNSPGATAGSYGTSSYDAPVGGGGGGGWGGASGGSLGSAGGSGYSPLNTTYVTNGAASSVDYGSRAIELLVNGVQVKLIANAIDSYSLANA
jgi:hypothetical protein